MSVPFNLDHQPMASAHMAEAYSHAARVSSKFLPPTSDNRCPTARPGCQPALNFMPNEADLEAFSPGRVAAVGVRGRAVIYISQK